MFLAYDIVVTNKKDYFINNRKLDTLKIYSLDEFINKIYYSYDKKTVYYVMKEYNVIYDIAKIYLDNIRYVEDISYHSDKLNFLKELKNKLISKKLIKEDKLFKRFIKNKKILFYGIEKNKELDKLNLNIDYKDVECDQYKHKVYSFKTLEDEVVFVAEKICELLDSGVDINNICIMNIDGEYRKIIRRIFPMFNIRFNIKNEDTIYGTYLVSKFIDLYNEDMEGVLEELSKNIDNEEDQFIFNKIVDVLNRYVEFDNYLEIKDLVIEDLKKIKVNNKEYVKAIREVDEDCEINEEYVFLLNFNQGVIPRIYKDEDYLNDKEKEELGLSLTVDKNNLERIKVLKRIKSIKNMIITYKEYYNGEEYKISNLIDDLGFEIIRNVKNKNNYSNIYNELYLASLKDLYNKYGVESEELNVLDNYYKNLDYNSYNNEFTGINKDELGKLLDNKLSLSYSSLDKYYKCPFSYYLDKIIKINIYEDTFYQTIGTLFHAILQNYFEKKGTFEILWEQELEKINNKLGAKERFFLIKLKEELKFVIDTIEYQETLTDLHEELYEEKIYTSISGNIGITFTGIVDKIKYKKNDDCTIVALIDYKTGNADIDLSLLPYGLSMQLPVYIYLAKNNKRFNKVKVAGFYIQKILNSEESNNDDKDYKLMKRKKLLLHGFSNADKEILSYMDNSYEDSLLIKSMKVKKDGDFSAYSKVLTDKDMDVIENIVVSKIKDCANKINDGSFEIAPKVVDNKNISCSFCNYKDICYKKNEDVVELKRMNMEEVLGGDKDGLD